MKKSLLLIALPALLVLSSCNNANGRANKIDYFKEDTVAHEEFFGGSELAPKRLGDPEEDPESGGEQFTLTPKIGVQFVSYTESAQTLYAVRYVAAVDLTSLDGITAEWTRGVSEKDGNQIKSLGGGHNSTVLYASLNNGGTPKAATSETGGEYKNYLVYSMYGIPASQVDSYIVAYLTLSDGSHTPVKSKAVAAKIDGGNAFSFASNTNAHFIQGTINGTRQVKFATNEENGGNLAEYIDVDLKDTDSFGSFYFSSDESSFEYYGNALFDSSISNFKESATLTGYVTPLVSGGYSLYVSKSPENHVFTAKTKNVYNLSLGDFFVSSNPIKIHAWGGGADYDELIYDGSGDEPTSFVLPSYLQNYLFARLNSGETDYGAGWVNVNLQKDGAFFSRDDVVGYALVSYNGSGFVSNSFSAGTLQFGLTHDTLSDSRFVYVCGSLTGGFNKANSIKLTKGYNNSWYTPLAVTAGSYEYKYVIADENWASVDWDTLNGSNRSITIS